MAAGRQLALALAAGLLVLLGLAAIPAGACAGPCGQADYDGDGLYDWADNCPRASNIEQQDSDGDAPPPLFDLGPAPESLPTSKESPLRVYLQPPIQTDPALGSRPSGTGGDACDDDDDNDGVLDRRTAAKTADNCRLAPNPEQRDSDGDGAGDACDTPALPDEEPAAGAAAAAARVTAAVPRAVRFDAVGTGVIVGVRCTAACRVTGSLTLDRRSSSRVVLPRGARTLVLGRGTAFLEGAGRTYLFLPVRAATLRKLARATPRLRPVLRVATGDGKAVTSRRITLRR